MAGEIVQMKEGIAYREEQLSHLDAVLRELDPSYRSDSIRPKKLRRMVKTGGQANRPVDAPKRNIKEQFELYSRKSSAEPVLTLLCKYPCGNPLVAVG